MKAASWPWLKKGVVTVPPTTTIMGAAKTMVGYGYRRLPVADAGTKRIIGICTVIDIIDFLGGGDKRRIVDRLYDGNMIVAINGPVTEIMEEKVVTVSDDASPGRCDQADDRPIRRRRTRH